LQIETLNHLIEKTYRIYGNATAPGRTGGLSIAAVFKGRTMANRLRASGDKGSLSATISPTVRDTCG